MRVAPEIQSWGEDPTSRESSYHVSCIFKALTKQKNASAQGSLKFREVSNSFPEGTRREKTCQKKVTYLITYLLTYLSQLDVLLQVAVLCFLQVQIMHILVGNVQIELVPRAGPTSCRN